MSVKKFRFVSPGVFIKEIDNSQLPELPEEIGPAVIGRSLRGPSMRPVQVDSFSSFVQTFGNPVAGKQGGDVWRDGNTVAPTYAAYGAQAYLDSSSPLNFVRVVGVEHTNAATTATKAGWKTGAGPTSASSDNNGAFGLFIGTKADTGETWSNAANTGSAGDGKNAALAAIWYVTSGYVRLRGDNLDTSSETSGSAIFLESNGSNFEFKMDIVDSTDTLIETIVFNMNPDSKKYIRNVFNTDPSLTNSDITDASALKTYWLGQTYERSLQEELGVSLSAAAAGNQCGILLSMQETNDNIDGYLYNMQVQTPKTPWIFGQHLGLPSQWTADSTGDYPVQNLFKVHSLYGAEWECANLKISIRDVVPSKNNFDSYGSFTLEVRDAADKDSNPQVLETYTNLNLDPSSPDYIARRIGDMTSTWSDSENRYIEAGNYANVSRYIRVEMAAPVDAGTADAQLLPFGFYGPVKFRDVTAANSGSAELRDASTNATGTPFARGWDASEFIGFVSGNAEVTASVDEFTRTLAYPRMYCRESSLNSTDELGLSNPRNVYWGIKTHQFGAPTRIDNGYIDVARSQADAVSNTDRTSGSAGYVTDYAFVFSLDDIAPNTTNSNQATWTQGNRTTSNSFTSTGSYDGTYEVVLNQGFNRFTVPMVGGFDGLDIAEKEPFRNTLLDGQTEYTHYAYASIKRAIDTVADPEVVECNLMAVPGITESTLTDHLIDVCEERADAMAIIDLENDYVPSTEGTSAGGYPKTPDPDAAITSLKNRSLNTSYAACYFPWVQIQDTIDGSLLWAPPSIAALGTLSSSQNKTEVWFAPAGFNRGGLTDGSAGIPVTAARYRLTSKERDNLYEVNINPIASFPSEGIVIFGQKTLQVTQSALDRINVRRMLLFVKKEISRIAANLLFDQNVEITWARFRVAAERLLSDVQARFGLTEFRVVLDETTTTPDLIDRNIMYAQVFLKPARAIEFIAIDFNITNTGASFVD
jgi:hypothetical protein